MRALKIWIWPKHFIYAGERECERVKCKGTITINEGKKYFYDQKTIKSSTDIVFTTAHA